MDPVFFQVKRGEMIVREGERVDEQAYAKLQAQNQTVNRADFFSRAVGVFWSWHFSAGRLFRRHPDSRRRRPREKDYLILTTLLMFHLILAYAAFSVGQALDSAGPAATDHHRLSRALAAGGMLAHVPGGVDRPDLLHDRVGPGRPADERGPERFFLFRHGNLAGLSGAVRVRERGAVIKPGPSSACSTSVGPGPGPAGPEFPGRQHHLRPDRGLINGFLTAMTVGA